MSGQDKDDTDQDTSSVTHYGKVIFFDNKKGFGFIKPDVGGSDIYVDYKGIAFGKRKGKSRSHKSLQDGKSVSYKLGQGVRGVFAVQVIPAK